MSQDELNKMFAASEEARRRGLVLDNGWGSSHAGDKDTLWDSNKDVMWERDHPTGAWYVVPVLGQDDHA